MRRPPKKGVRWLATRASSFLMGTRLLTRRSLRKSSRASSLFSRPIFDVTGMPRAMSPSRQLQQVCRVLLLVAAGTLEVLSAVAEVLDPPRCTALIDATHASPLKSKRARTQRVLAPGVCA